MICNGNILLTLTRRENMKISGNNASIVMPNLYWFIGISAVEHSKWEGGGRHISGAIAGELYTKGGIEFSWEHTEFAVKVLIEWSKVDRLDNVMLSVSVKEVVSLSKTILTANQVAFNIHNTLVLSLLHVFFNGICDFQRHNQENWEYLEQLIIKNTSAWLSVKTVSVKLCGASSKPFIWPKLFLSDQR